MKQKNNFLGKLKRYRVLLLMLLPAVLYVILFNYIPMAGIVLAFKKYNYVDGIFGSPWNGVDNFRFFFKSGQAWKVTRNTFLYNAAFIIVNNILQLAVAIFLVEIKNKRFRKVSQSFMFLPYFISWVVVSVIAFNILSYDYGIVNKVIVAFGGEKVNLYNMPKIWPLLLYSMPGKVWDMAPFFTWLPLWELTHPSTRQPRLTEQGNCSAFLKLPFRWCVLP